MKHSSNKNEFTIINLYSRKNSRYGVWMAMCMVFASVATIFARSSLRFAAIAVFIVLMGVLLFLKVRENNRKSTLIVADDKLEYESEVLLPEEIARIELGSQTVFIQRNKGMRFNLNLALKDREEFERLIPRMREFGRLHNIKVEVVK